jgi:hypothetical protein
VSEIDGPVRYVGKTKGSLKRRLQKHISTAKQGSPFHVSRWLRKVGFAVVIDLVAVVEGNGCAEEVALIAGLRKIGLDLTNSTPGGDGNVNPSEEMRRKISAKLTGRKLSAEHRKNISLGNLGKKLSPERCAQIGDLHRGKAVSAETREKMAAAKRGTTLSAETRAKVSAALKKRGPLSEATLVKMRASQAARGPRSPETRAKMSASAKARRAREAAAILAP